jgi:hypothetical protein
MIDIIESMIDGIGSLNNEDKGIGEICNLSQIVDKIF